MVDSHGETSESTTSSSPAHDRDGLDVSTPNVARMYDFYLGGKDNYAADREAAMRILAVVPEVPMAALENREFLRRALRFLVKDAGIRQFIDIGPGLPTQSNVHHIVQGLNPAARVVYADNDPVVLMRSRSLLHHVPGVAIVREDLRRPGRLLSSPGLEALIDFDEPVALCMTLVLQFIPESNA